ncbi:MAG: Flp family type IVb pilin [Halomonas sp.]|uniref:Flp family type IVb pilin n=1 Tax=Halomonas sp. TaxID=1486246 RepID=UPI003F930AE2
MKLITFLYTYVTSLHRDTKGATAIEYAVIAGIMAIALIAALTIFSGDDGAFATFFNSIADQLSSAGDGE